MANIKSAKKRILVNRAKALRNQMAKSQLKTFIKKFNAAVAAEDKAAYIAANGEKVFSINGYFYSFKGAPGADLGYNVGTSTANQNHTFSEGDHGFVTYNYKLEWNERNYVRPIPQSALNVNKNLKQNVLWEGI